MFESANFTGQFLWITLASIALLVVGLVATPILAVCIPADYFQRASRQPDRAGRTAGGRRSGWRLAQNIGGWLLIVLGLAMLVLPGPGILLVLVGIVLADFPGKYRVQRWLITRKGVLTTINRIRRRFGRPPLEGAPAGQQAT